MGPGSVASAQGNVTRAVSLLGQAIGIHDKLIQDFPDVTEHRRRLGVAYGSLGDSLCDLGKLSEAEDAYRRTVSIWAKLGADHSGEQDFLMHVAQSHESLGRFLYRSGRHGEATSAFLRARDGYERLVADFPAEDSWKYWLAELLGECPDPKVANRAGAVRLATEAVDLQPWKGDNWRLLGFLCYRAGDWDRAVRALENARRLGSDDGLGSWFVLAMSYWRRGEPDQARAWLNKANRRMEEDQVKDHDILSVGAEATALLGMTENRTTMGKKDENATRQSKP